MEGEEELESIPLGSKTEAGGAQDVNGLQRRSVIAN